MADAHSLAEKAEQGGYAVDSSGKSISSGSHSHLGSNDEVEKIVGAQIAQESDHAVKYRTCSWQKVRAPFLPVDP